MMLAQVNQLLVASHVEDKKENVYVHVCVFVCEWERETACVMLLLGYSCGELQQTSQSARRVTHQDLQQGFCLPHYWRSHVMSSTSSYVSPSFTPKHTEVNFIVLENGLYYSLFSKYIWTGSVDVSGEIRSWYCWCWLKFNALLQQSHFFFIIQSFPWSSKMYWRWNKSLQSPGNHTFIQDARRLSYFYSSVTDPLIWRNLESVTTSGI